MLEGPAPGADALVDRVARAGFEAYHEGWSLLVWEEFGDESAFRWRMCAVRMMRQPGITPAELRRVYVASHHRPAWSSLTREYRQRWSRVRDAMRAAGDVA